MIGHHFRRDYDNDDNHQAVVQYLVSQGADLHARDNKGETPLDLASHNYHWNPEVVEYLASITDSQEISQKTLDLLAKRRGGISIYDEFVVVEEEAELMPQSEKCDGGIPNNV
jgi:ankyrin repeat protein